MSEKLKVLDLFSGIGGFSLGLERTGGFETVAFCEIEPFPRKVLKKHWPEVPCYEDVTKLTGAIIAADGIRPNVICGGFPCQDISTAGKGAGIEGERSGLWKEYARLIGELRPDFAIMENVSALLGRGLDVVLGDLAQIGYDAEWHCIPASAVGAPHRRDRVWIVAYHTQSQRNGSGEHRQQGKRQVSEPGDDSGKVALAYATGQRQQGQGQPIQSISQTQNGNWETGILGSMRIRKKWFLEPNVGRVANGVPSRVDRLKGLGNAVVPQIPELIGRAILADIQQ